MRVFFLALTLLLLSGLASAHKIELLYRDRFDVEDFLLSKGVERKEQLSPTDLALLEKKIEYGATVGHVAIHWKDWPSAQGLIVGWVPQPLETLLLPPGVQNTWQALFDWMLYKGIGTDKRFEHRWVPGFFSSDEVWAVAGARDDITPTMAVELELRNIDILEAQARQNWVHRYGRYQMARSINAIGNLTYPPYNFNCLTAVNYVLGPFSPLVRHSLPEWGGLQHFIRETEFRARPWQPTCEALMLAGA